MEPTKETTFLAVYPALARVRDAADLLWCSVGDFLSYYDCGDGNGAEIVGPPTITRFDPEYTELRQSLADQRIQDFPANWFEHLEDALFSIGEGCMIAGLNDTELAEVCPEEDDAERRLPAWYSSLHHAEECLDGAALGIIRAEQELALRAWGEEWTARYFIPDGYSPEILRQLATEDLAPSIAKWDKPTEARNKWIYEKACECVPWKTIMAEVNGHSEWEPIRSIQGVKAVADRYAVRKRLPPPPSRQSGRPKNAHKT